MKIRLNLAALIRDCGGASATAKIAGVVRTAPYSWMKRRYISSRVLERIKEARPDLDINIYFDDEDNHEEQTGSSAGVSG